MSKKKYYIIDYSFFIYMGSFAHKNPCQCSVVNSAGKLVAMKDDCSFCDGKGMAYFHKSGVRTGGLYQVFNHIIKALSDGYTPILVFDPPKEDLDRTELLDSYKGNRKECPEWITYQMDWGENNLQYIENVECYTSPNHESDDVIATKALELGNQGYEVIVAADDKDFFPTLKCKNVTLFRQKAMFTRAHFKAKFGFDVDRWEEYLAIIGDTADNYNLIKGLGDKAACDIIANYKNLDDFLKDSWSKCNNRTQSAIKKLVDSIGRDKFEEELARSLKLAQLNLKVDYVRLDPEPNKKLIEDELKRFGLNQALNRVDLMFTGV
jgi:5'-3' exonuclease